MMVFVFSKLLVCSLNAQQLALWPEIEANFKSKAVDIKGSFSCYANRLNVDLANLYLSKNINDRQRKNRCVFTGDFSSKRPAPRCLFCVNFYASNWMFYIDMFIFRTVYGGWKLCSTCSVLWNCLAPVFGSSSALPFYVRNCIRFLMRQLKRLYKKSKINSKLFFFSPIIAFQIHKRWQSTR